MIHMVACGIENCLRGETMEKGDEIAKFVTCDETKRGLNLWAK